MRRLAKALAFGFVLIACAPKARSVRSADEPRSESGPLEAANAGRGPDLRRVGREGDTRTAPREQAEPPSSQDVASSGLESSRVALFDGPPLKHLLPFYQELTKLAWGERMSPIRIYWLGDSHTAADFMTHPVRQRLEGFVRPGGPGFVRVGLDGYRHGAVSVRNQGRFRKAPLLPAQRTRVLDGVFGYGGIRTLPGAGASSRLEYRVPEGVGEDAQLHWTLSARLPPGASLWVRIAEQEPRVVATDSQEQGGFVRYVVEGAAGQPLTIAHRSGSPEIFGVFGELLTPGVVLDTVGINGARAATPLAWEPEQHVQAVTRRSPDLLVLAFGTNEVFDRGAPERYTEHTTSLVNRVRAARAGLPCWVIGPPDAGAAGGLSRSRVSEVTLAQRRAAEESGCSFTSAAELMGGEGAFGRWMSRRPALARGDYVHLTIAGYERLGSMLADVLLGTLHEKEPDELPLGRIDGFGLESRAELERTQRSSFWRSRYASYSFISAR